ncbi:MAG: hypothetical protein JRI68_35165 [Deltaproteobacteria bacterium]|nr:hypothetical protein [Deltaproteobacteria bacterium]
MTRDKLWVGLVAGLLVATGCSDDSDTQTTSTGGTGGTTSSGGGEGGDGGQDGGDTLTILVQEWNGTPIEGAGVAIDVAGADRIEATSDAQGLVTVADFDMASLISIIGHQDGWTYSAASAAYVSETFDVASEPVVLNVTEIEPTFVTLSGAATNMVDEGHGLDIGTTQPVDLGHQALGPNWSVGVRPNTPFTIFAVEYISGGALPQGSSQTFVAWDQLYSPGVSSDETMTLDFGVTTTTQTASGSFAQPTNESLAVGGWAYVMHSTYDHGRGAFLGASTTTQASQDDTRFDYDVEWIEIEGHDVVTTYMVRTWTPSNTPKEFSGVTVDGPPVGGSQDLGLHNPPEITVANFVADPVAWTPVEGETYDAQFVRMTADNGPQGDYLVGATETEATTPALPSTSDASQMFQGSLRVYVGNCVGYRHRDVCDKLSYGSANIL